MLPTITSSFVTKILGITLLVVGAAALVLLGLYWRADGAAALERERTAAASQRATQAESVNRENTATLRTLRDQAETNARLAAAALARERAAADRLASFTRSFQELTRNDPQTRDWARQPVPAAVRRLLDNPAGAAGADGGGGPAHAGGAAVPAQRRAAGG